MLKNSNERSVCLHVLIMSRTRFRVNPHSIVVWMSRNFLLETGSISEVLSDCNGTRTRSHLVHKRTLNHLSKLANLANWLNVRWRTKWFWVPVPLQSVKRNVSFRYLLVETLIISSKLCKNYLKIFDPWNQFH